MNDNFHFNQPCYGPSQAYLQSNLGQGYPPFYGGVPQPVSFQTAVGYPANSHAAHPMCPPSSLSPGNGAGFNYYQTHFPTSLHPQSQAPQFHPTQGVPQHMQTIIRGNISQPFVGLTSSQSMFQIRPQTAPALHHHHPSVMPQHHPFVVSSQPSGYMMPTAAAQNQHQTFASPYPTPPPNIFPNSNVATSTNDFQNPPSFAQPSQIYKESTAPSTLFIPPHSNNSSVGSTNIPNNTTQSAATESVTKKARNILVFYNPNTGANVLDPDAEPRAEIVVAKEKEATSVVTNSPENLVEVPKAETFPLEQPAAIPPDEDGNANHEVESTLIEEVLSQNIPEPPNQEVNHVNHPEVLSLTETKETVQENHEDITPLASEEIHKSSQDVSSISDNREVPMNVVDSSGILDSKFVTEEVAARSAESGELEKPLSNEASGFDDKSAISASQSSEVSRVDYPSQTCRYTIDTLLELAELPQCLRIPPHMPSAACVTECQMPSEYLDKIRMQSMICSGKPDRVTPEMSGYRPYSKPIAPVRRQPTTITLPQRDIGFREASNTYVPQFKSHASISEADRLHREMKSLLNKLTPENFSRICDQIATLNIQTMDDMLQLCTLIFEKATEERKYTSTFAKLVCELKSKISISEGQDQVTFFKNPVIRFCQTLFETRIEDHLQYQEKALNEEIQNQLDERTKSILLGNKKDKLKRKEEQYYGNMRFIGELIRLGVLKPGIFFVCQKQLLIESVHALDCLCELYFTVGSMVDICSDGRNNPQNEDAFHFIRRMSVNERLETRIRCKLMDLIEMRARGWRKRELQEKLLSGPMTRQELQRMTEQEEREKEFLRKEQNYMRNSNQGTSNIPSGGMSLGRSQSRNQSINPASLHISEKHNYTKSMMNGPDPSCKWNLGSHVTPRQQSHPVAYSQDARAGPSNSDYNLSKGRQMSMRDNRTHSPVTSKGPRKFATQSSVSSMQGDSSTGNSGRSTPTQRYHYNHSNEGVSTFQTPSAPTSFPLLHHLKEPQGPSSRVEHSISSVPSLCALDSVELKPLEFEELQRKCDIAYREYLASGCFEEPGFHLHPLDHKNMVEMMISVSFDERSATARNKAGDYLRRLIELHYLEASSLSLGLTQILNQSVDLLTDYPELWDYLAEVLEAFIVDSDSRIGFILELKSPPESFITHTLSHVLRLAGKRLGGEIVAYVFYNSKLTWSSLLPPGTNVANFLNEHQLSFLEEASSSSDQYNSSQTKESLMMANASAVSFSEAPQTNLANNNLTAECKLSRTSA